MCRHQIVEPEPDEIIDPPLALIANPLETWTESRDADVLSSTSSTVSCLRLAENHLDQKLLIDAMRVRLLPLAMIPEQLIELAALAESLDETASPDEPDRDSLIALGMALEITAERLEAIIGKLQLSLHPRYLKSHQPIGRGSSLDCFPGSNENARVSASQSMATST